jgi:hypothetical protein
MSTLSGAEGLLKAVVIFCFYGSKTPQTLQSKECGVKKLTLID